ncbi:PIN domain-like family protein [Arabidopsis thaliana]|uniref:PIN domain-like family protein n=1 Tax=Arabidopsis thaliana TaxID=3702 RepID=F4IR78_ARATH|nr:PIN domain-like family protein [Arabidopsis thaliana]AEC05594.1 PIN domain-like family protein [Arabidopsis thaliana]|eukprot:NP_001154488.1 PIN domain-like family protein [Arabidopsis thaliana]
MGFTSLYSLYGKSKVLKSISFSALNSKTLAIDASMWLYRGALNNARKFLEEPTTPNSEHIMFVIKKVKQFIDRNVNPILVFDGHRLPIKSPRNPIKTLEYAKDLDASAQLMAPDDPKRKDKEKNATKIFQSHIHITPYVIHVFIEYVYNQVIEELQHLNVPEVSNLPFLRDRESGDEFVIRKYEDSTGTYLSTTKTKEIA